MVHGRVDTDNDVGAVRLEAFLYASAAGDSGVNVGTHLVEFGVGQMVKEPPFEWVGRHALVGVDERSVGKDSVVGPQVGQFVSRTGELNQKLYSWNRIEKDCASLVSISVGERKVR